jgi:transcriptional regulator with PAS, ATPase and Fis domain
MPADTGPPCDARSGGGMSGKALHAEVMELRSQLKMHRMILDSIHNGVMVTDANGIVIHFNKPYGQFLRLDPAQQIGRHCTEVVETTRMHIVAQTGLAEINKAQWINGQNMVVQRIPIKKDGHVMFKDVKDVRQLAQRLSVLESKVKIYEEALINLRSTQMLGIHRTLLYKKMKKYGM